MRGVPKAPKIVTDETVDVVRRMRKTALIEGYRYISISFTTLAPRFTRSLKQARHGMCAVYDYETHRWFGAETYPWTPSRSVGGGDA